MVYKRILNDQVKLNVIQRQIYVSVTFDNNPCKSVQAFLFSQGVVTTPYVLVILVAPDASAHTPT